MKPRLERPEEAAARLGSEILTPNERALLWSRIQSTREGFRPGRSRRIVFALAAAGAFAALAAVALFFTLKNAPQVAERQTPEPSCHLDPRDRTLALAPGCDAEPVRVGEDEWTLAPGARVARVDDGARVESGRVEFRVQPRERSSFRVHVGEGHQVRVVGTVFVIESKGASGSVSVSEGVIEFTWSDGERERVAAGQTLLWPRSAARSPTVRLPERPSSEAATPSRNTAPAAGSSVKPPTSAASANLEDVMDRVLQLKSQRRLGELIALLERTLRSREVSPVQRQRLSYELGLALDAAGRSSCDHWKRHAKSYGAGSPGGTLAGRLERCKP